MLSYRKENLEDYLGHKLCFLSRVIFTLPKTAQKRTDGNQLLFESSCIGSVKPLMEGSSIWK